MRIGEAAIVRHRVLVLEEDVSRRAAICRALSSGARTSLLVTAESASRPATHRMDVDLVVVGPNRGDDETTLGTARALRARNRTIPIIVIVSHSSERMAIDALRIGVNDYFVEPVQSHELIAGVDRCLASALGAITASEDPSCIIGSAPRMVEIREYIERIAPTNSTVLITGETGTGKELAARLIHDMSRRRQKPFVNINCAAIPDTLLESELFGYERGAFTGALAASAGKLKAADGGTVLLDEIGDMSTYAQAKILRLIESREIERLGGRRSTCVDLRIIAATNQDLDGLIATARFRKDLYFRLNVARIHLPPLRERREDIPALLDHYVQEVGRSVGREIDGVTDDALSALREHDWPGNVRELRNLVESVVPILRSARIGLADLPPPYQHRMRGPNGSSGAHERDRLLSALNATRWNKSKTAQQLRWSRMTVYRKIARYHLSSQPAPPPLT